MIDIMAIANSVLRLPHRAAPVSADWPGAPSEAVGEGSRQDGLRLAKVRAAAAHQALGKHPSHPQDSSSKIIDTKIG